MTGDLPVQRYSSCQQCGKRGYPDRKTAKAKARQVRNESLSVYRCPDTPDWAQALWHIGHLPKAVRRGLVTKDQVYGPREVST